MPTAKIKYKRTDLVSEKIDDQEVVLNHLKGTIITLNPTASEIYSSLKTPKTINQIINQLEIKYVSVPVTDISSTLANMEKSGLIMKLT